MNSRTVALVEGARDDALVDVVSLAFALAHKKAIQTLDQRYIFGLVSMVDWRPLHKKKDLLTLVIEP